MVDAVKQIQADHQNMDKVLQVLLEAGTNLLPQESDDTLSVLNDAVYYVPVFAEKFHHPMEENVLFPLVRERLPDITEILECLEAQHEQGARTLHESQTKLRELEQRGQSRGFRPLGSGLRTGTA